MIRKLTFLLLLFSLGACRFLTGENGYFRDRQGDYLSAPIEPDMRIPESLDSYTLDPLYVVPEQFALASGEFAKDVPRPKALDTNRPEGVVIQRIGGEAWIVIAATPQQVWPRVRDFWIERGQALDYENPVEGIMESAWVDAVADLSRLDKFRIRIEPGLRAGSSEVYVYYQDRLRLSPAPALPAWPSSSANDGTGYTVLEQLSQYLADRTDIYSSSSASLLAGSLAGESKSTLGPGPNGQQELNLRIGMVRAWAQVAQSLERSDIAVLDSNREDGLYEVQFAGNGVDVNRPGFFSRVFRRDGDENGTSLPHFQVRLENTGSGIRITATPNENTDENSRLAEELLQTILSNLG